MRAPFRGLSGMATTDRDLHAWVHELKTWPEMFQAISSGEKPFEVRRDDRGFEVGDWLRLREFEDVAQRYTGRELRRRISYVLPGGQFGLAPEFVVLGLSDKPDQLQAEVDRLRGLLNAPELHDFAAGVTLEAAHQRERWGEDHDAGKAPTDWFWLVGYLAGKALHAAIAGDRDKALHHCISTAAALANWHAALLGADNRMRPGISPPPGEDPF